MEELKKKPGMILYREELALLMMMDPTECQEAIKLLYRRFEFQEEPKTENARLKFFLEIAIPKQEADEEKYRARQLNSKKAGEESGRVRRAKANERSTNVQQPFNEDEPEPTNSNKQEQEQEHKQDIYNNNKYISSNSDQVKPDLESDFSTFWEPYPRHEDRAKAFKAYTKARKAGASKQDLEDGARRYAQKIQAERTEKQFIKLGATWLNGRCWENDYQDTAAAAPVLINTDQSYADLEAAAQAWMYK